jgi:predicted O-methyltransferase YrrM
MIGMFHDIPDSILAQMATLEALDARDRLDGTPKVARLRQIPAETGRFLALLAASAPSGPVLEVGTSGGYSGLWLSLACLRRGDSLTTFDLDSDKVRRALGTFSAAGVADRVQVVLGDARQHLAGFAGIAFCFLDTEKDIYLPCYETVIPRLAPGGFLVADNLISHQEELSDFLRMVQADRRVDVLVVPIGKGLLVCRRA